MSDIRFDPITGHWVTIAPNRNDRPVEFIPAERVIKRILCPFCAGNELETPASMGSYDKFGNLVSDDKTWLVRVFANKYPSFSVAGGKNGILPEANGHAPGDGLYESLSSHGLQELIIPSYRHIQSLGSLTAEEMRVAHLAYRDRIEFASRQDLAHPMLFTNCRSSAGASLEHIHTQLIVAPMLSDAVKQRVARNNDYRDKYQKDLIHALNDWELSREDRVVEQSENFSVICPYASRFAFQTWIVPKPELPTFHRCDESILEELAMLSRKQIVRLESVLDEPAYNVLFHLPPFAQMETQPWFVEIFPRITTPAGFELGTDIWVNPVSPEIATRRLRQASQ
jgi:UDPglucose--hexose-1-phosphate uridylyltransferase